MVGYAILSYNPREDSFGVRRFREISNTNNLQDMSENSGSPTSRPEIDKTTMFTPSLYGGRFTRAQYFWRMLAAVLIIGILSHMIQVSLHSANGYRSYMKDVMIVNLIVDTLAMVFVYWPIAIKRAHDIGYSGTFVVFLSIIGLLIQLLLYAAPDLGVVLSVVMLIPNLIYGLILLFRDSQKGRNAYGDSTKYPSGTRY